MTNLNELTKMLKNTPHLQGEKAEKVKQLLRNYPLIRGVYLLENKGYDDENRLIVFCEGNRNGLNRALNEIFDNNATVLYDEDFTEECDPCIEPSARLALEEVRKGLVLRVIG